MSETSSPYKSPEELGQLNEKLCEEKEQLTEKVSEAQRQYVEASDYVGKHSCGGFQRAYGFAHQALSIYEAARLALAAHITAHGC